MVKVVELTLTGDSADVEESYHKLLELLRKGFFKVAYQVHAEDYEEGEEGLEQSGRFR